MLAVADLAAVVAVSRSRRPYDAFIRKKGACAVLTLNAGIALQIPWAKKRQNVSLRVAKKKTFFGNKRPSGADDWLLQISWLLSTTSQDYLDEAWSRNRMHGISLDFASAYFTFLQSSESQIILRLTFFGFSCRYCSNHNFIITVRDDN